MPERHEGGRGCVGRRWGAWLLAALLLSVMPALSALPLQAGQDYLLFGRATDQQAPVRACTPEMRQHLQRHIEIPPPAGGWSGAPQAVEVFNAFHGEVMIHQGERTVCGHAQDARTRDSRFRAGTGMVTVPPTGSMEPIEIAWERPLKPGWIPVVRLGTPSDVQQRDTQRLLVRSSCLAIAWVLALSALMGFLSTRSRNFLFYALLCLLMMLWQAIFSGLSGYPRPWLPVGNAASQWLVSMSALAYAALVWLMWWICGGWRRFPALRVGLRVLSLLLLGVALLAPWLPLAALSVVAVWLDHGFAVACLLSFAVAVWLLRRRDYNTMDGVVALPPLLAMVLANWLDAEWLVRYRIEVIQLAVSWFLIISAFSLNRSLDLLRRQRDEMRQLADTDMLTGLPNRRAGLRQLERHLQQSRKDAQPLAIGFLDIDLFKQINDRFGHDVGDEVLVSVANALLGAVRNRDDVIRMGGEEFLVLLPGASVDAALLRLEQLRDRIGQLAPELRHDGLVITASIGLAQMQPGDDVAALLRRADNAMYQAKRGGRNRVVDARTEPDVA
ncbi:MAG: diguanylate cyclase [Stenotrophomonas sp.]